MRAYRHRCVICALRERSLVQAAHIVPDIEPEGIAAVVNGLALPQRPEDRPDRARLEARFARFDHAAA
jgi:hypothetical protein